MKLMVVYRLVMIILIQLGMELLLLIFFWKKVLFTPLPNSRTQATTENKSTSAVLSQIHTSPHTFRVAMNSPRSEAERTIHGLCWRWHPRRIRLAVLPAAGRCPRSGTHNTHLVRTSRDSTGIVRYCNSPSGCRSPLWSHQTQQRKASCWMFFHEDQRAPWGCYALRKNSIIDSCFLLWFAWFHRLVTLKTQCGISNYYIYFVLKSIKIARR